MVVSHIIYLFLLSFVRTTLSDLDPIDRDFYSSIGHDLATFKSEPDIRHPLFNISVNEKQLVAPGYWFIAPYTSLQQLPPSLSYQPAQIGPNIFDGEGNLVWTGAPLFNGRNVYDFKALNSGELSLILGPNKYYQWDKTDGAGLRLDSSYRIIGTTPPPNGSESMNMHEYKIIEDDNSALLITDSRAVVGDIGVWDEGFAEIDINTGDIKFEWSSLQDIDLSTSYDDHLSDQSDTTGNWDWIHLNSVDKTADGDYIISARATWTIYRISGQNGSILWQLGGKNSSFATIGFNFSYQHDARVLYENKTTTIISFMNNACDDTRRPTADWSEALLVALDTATMTATLLRRLDRPDHRLSRARGNVQTLANNNVFVAWSDNGYITEFTEDGRLILEASFASHRYVTYRTYKFNFTGTPITPPSLVSHAYGSFPEKATTMHYVSWNGATEVTSWNFYGSEMEPSSFLHLGTVKKTGFETSLTSDRYIAFVYAEAIAANGTILGRSPTKKTVEPVTWEASGTYSRDRYFWLRLVEISAFFSVLCGGLLGFERYYWRRKKWNDYIPVDDDDSSNPDRRPELQETPSLNDKEETEGV